LVGRFTRSASLTAFTGAGVFTYLWVMINEPMHPGGLLGLSIALAAWLGAEAIASGRIVLFAALVGTIGAAVALIKINVGVFLLLAAFAWLLLHTPVATRWARWALALLFLALPIALMHTLFDAPWVRMFALIFATSMLAVLVGARPGGSPVKRHVWLVFLGAGGLATAVICGLTRAHGTSLTGLLTGVVFEPLKHPGVYFFAFSWRAGALPLLVAGLIVCLLSDHFGGNERFRHMVAWIRLGMLGAALLSPLKLIPTSLAAFGMSYGVGMAGLLVLPLRRNTLATVRLWLALVLVLQLLHAYPIAGSQINWATFLWLPLLALGVHEALEVLAERNRNWLRFMRLAVSGLLVASAAFMGGQLVKTGWTNHHVGEPLQLPGAENIILPDDTVFALRIITENARRHGDVLLSLPGAYSFNLWSGLSTPTLANATHWFSLLSTSQQEAIMARLDQSPRACLVVQMDTLQYIVAHGFRPHGELAEYLGQKFKQAFEVDHYAFWVRQGREVAPFSTGVLLPREGAPDAQRLELVLAAPEKAVAAIELWEITGQGRIHRLTLSAANATLDVTPLDETGRPTGAAQQLLWPAVVPEGIVRLGTGFSGELPAPGRLLAFVLDAHGHRLAAARVLLK
jgi:hypothetical protein